MSVLSVTKKIEFDAGHRLPNHYSKCKNLHGHHYSLEITLEGEINTTPNETNEGMLIDFSEIKEITEKCIIKPWDHAFFVYKNDSKVKNFLETLDNHKTIVTELPPTAEHLAQMAFEVITSELNSHTKSLNNKVTLTGLKLYETPTSWAEIKTKGEL